MQTVLLCREVGQIINCSLHPCQAKPSQAKPRPGYNHFSLLVLCVGVYPGLWSIGVRLHSAVTGSYVPGHHSVLLLNSPNEQVAKDIGRYGTVVSAHHTQVKRQRYYWKGEVQDASEILMVSLQREFILREVILESVHPYANPEVLSFPVEGGSLSYMKWMDEAIPDD
uniref:Zgc:63972 n=1 Tax=Scophthalmus maximus TaxID=52904 RepID=A0A8D3EF21_SCOMX